MTNSSNNPDHPDYRDKPVNLDDCKIKKVDKGEQLMQLLKDTENDSLRMLGLINIGKVKGHDAELFMNQIQKIYEIELKKILN